MSKTFNWSELSVPEIAVLEQPAIAVHESETGDCVIRQMGSDGSGDTVIVVPRQRLAAFVEHVCRFALTRLPVDTDSLPSDPGSPANSNEDPTAYAAYIAGRGATIPEILAALAGRDTRAA